jgi:transcriptional regulator with XRE-family HTH domain
MARPPSEDSGIDQILAMVRKRYNMTQEEAQNKLGVQAPCVSRLRNDKRAASPRVILAVYDAGLGLSIEQIRKILEQ